ncbi:hypothetical protein RRG08_045743 [Elysia crispata]|uniref:Cadherin domain-containing protein n=1 Tax=Elysia crispata TaxID=231223 RepID=A0AAE1DCI2_9GAST|nr:hypothetical protein RRG08_045743 [Elysia crispata]
MAGRKPKTVNLWSLLLGLLLPSMVLSQDLIYNMFENEPIGTLIGNIGQDLNLTSGAPASVHYNILVSQNSQYFDVDHASGNLFTSAVLDREYICQYETTCGLEINVMASSGAYNQMFSITVMLLDVNDNTPSFSQAQFTLRISESAMIGSEFALPKAMDDDISSNNSIQSYSIRSMDGLPNAGPFRLEVFRQPNDAYDLKLVLINRLDREARDHYNLLLTAADGGPAPGPLEGSMILSVTVDDVNDNPPVFDRSRYSVNVRQDTTSGAVILTLRATDLDLGMNGAVQYRLGGQQDVSITQKLQVEPHTGEVRALGTLPVGNHTIIVEAVDGGFPQLVAHAVMEVTVIGIENTRPVITMMMLNSADPWALVSESAPLGTVVAVVTVSDPDSGLDGMVSCTSLSDSFGLQALTGNTYKVLLNRQLDRELEPALQVMIICEDMGNPSLNASQRFDVLVEDVNDNAPVLVDRSNVTVTIQENNNINDLVMLIEATDADTGRNAALQFHLLDDSQGSFHIPPGYNALLCSKVLDREMRDSHVVRVLVKDDGVPPLSATATITISVLDVNDNAPKFPQDSFSFSIMEHSPAGVYIGKVAAFDPDLGENGATDFHIFPSSGQLEFQIEADGSLFSTSPLDREKVAMRSFMIEVSDRGDPQFNSQARVDVNIMDMNDNRPVFISPGPDTSSVTLILPVSSSQMVFEFKATDKDAGQNGEIHYSLMPHNSLFHLDQMQGELVTSRELTAQDVGVFNLTVTATDNGVPYWAAEKEFSVIVQNNSTN